ncbi:hypothetical protein D1AOALGA4SA_8876 [Olavius algarvensis Delta 1 endosymbiont]|nr:hypothetical protein D1AOALGA4SA_8876 [Olavius algarvensis Delta 1 endosymbiont]
MINDGLDQFIKSDRHPLSISNILFFHSSRGGSATFQYSIRSLSKTPPILGEIKAGLSGLGFFA